MPGSVRKKRSSKKNGESKEKSGAEFHGFWLLPIIQP
jgi:hypothetical protein